MRTALTIAAKELRTYFVSPVAYVVMLFLFGVSGLIFCLVISQNPEADMTGMLSTMVFLSLLIAPFMTMGLLSTERATGTIELLMTRPTRDVEVVIGKYLAAVALYAIMMLISMEFTLTMAKFGKLDWPATLGGYIGMLLCGMAFLAIGLFASSITDNQIVAVGTALVLLLFLWLVGFAAEPLGPALGAAVKHMSVNENFRDLAKGILDTKAILYYLSLIGFMLFLTVRSLENRRTV